MKKGTILIVEDDDGWRSILANCLSDSYDVTTVEDYASALDRVKTHSFDVAVLDLRLEDQDDENFQGMELLALLREKKQEENRITEVIINSAYGTHEHVRQGFKAYGLFDYIDKRQFDKKYFQDVVRRAVNSSQSRGNAKTF